jgi:hypothetical protein
MKLTLTGTALAATLVAITTAMALDASLPAYQAVGAFRDKSNRLAPIPWTRKWRFGPRDSKLFTLT